jgi:flavodoxin
MSSMIIFFSRSNNTRTGAEYLAGKLSAELVELLETKGRKGLTGFLRSGFQAATGKTSDLQGEPWQGLEKFTSIYLMTPIWASNGTPAMNTFLQKADLRGKEVTVVTFQADAKGSGSEKVHELMKSIIENNGGSFRKGIALHSAAPGKFAGKEYIQSQIDKFF